MDGIEKAVQKYEALRHSLLDNEFIVSNYKEINYGLQFLVQKLSWTGTIRIYQNKQGQVKVDLSQLDESENSNLVKGFFEQQSASSTTVNKAFNAEVNFPVLGSDESGKGDYFGSLVSACVYVDEVIASQLMTLGVRDSKALSDVKIVDIARQIKRICREKFVVIEISPERYNQIYARLINEKKSLNDLLAWAHAKAIEEILSKVQCDTAIVDQFAEQSLLLEKLQERGKELKIFQAPRAESHIAVAAASILARERFVNKLQKLGQQYQIDLPKGASKEVVAAAKRLVSSNGHEILGKVAKLHFKTTKEVLA